MTDSQRRYLFRLLAKRGVLGNDAKETLQKAFSVEHLREVSREAASALIDRLIREEEDAEHARRVAQHGDMSAREAGTGVGNGNEVHHGNS